MKKRIIHGFGLIILIGLVGCGQKSKSITKTNKVESESSYAQEPKTSYNASNIPDDAEIGISESEGKEYITVNGVIVSDSEIKVIRNDGTNPDPETYFSESQ